MPIFETESSLDFVTGYFRLLKQLLFAPTAFFRNLRNGSGLASALAFGLVTHWIGSALEYLVNTTILVSPGEPLIWNEILRKFQNYSSHLGVHGQRQSFWIGGMGEQIKQWFLSASSVALDPFQTLLTLLLTAVIMFVAARLFLNPRGNPLGPFGVVRYGGILQILAYSQAPFLLLFLPWGGELIAKVYQFVILVIGFREVYRTTNGRSILVGISPSLLLVMIVFLVLMLLLAGLLGFVTLVT